MERHYWTFRLQVVTYIFNLFKEIIFLVYTELVMNDFLIIIFSKKRKENTTKYSVHLITFSADFVVTLALTLLTPQLFVY